MDTQRDLRKLWGYIDHTLLKPAATWDQVRVICDEAAEKKAASVCIPPAFISRIKKRYGDSVTIGTVIGFPLGYNTTAAKVAEAVDAVKAGAGELDMVINLGETKAGNFDEVRREIAAIREVTPGVLKVIVETCYLSEEEKVQLCGVVTGAGADYIKTSTGFGSAGAVLADVKLFSKHIGPGVKIKAAGGISTLEELEAFIAAGASRIGTSRGMSILG
ncbi:MAG: deoxyribose-phosphate aldolase [Treponema sp.]|jgi:deoxyribose-phosphate aldolase|nr:deoxyribose-phosphate aldolase [Treponema sp.]